MTKQNGSIPPSSNFIEFSKSLSKDRGDVLGSPVYLNFNHKILLVNTFCVFVFVSKNKCNATQKMSKFSETNPNKLYQTKRMLSYYLFSHSILNN